MNPVIIRILSYLGGLAIVSFGVSLTIIAGLGVGAWDALNVGLANLTQFTVGNWVIIIGVILIFINGLLSKSRPQFLSIITVVLIGYFIDFWLLIVFRDVLFGEFFLQLSILFLGTVIIAFGAAIYLQAKFAVIPIDGLMLVVRDRFQVNFLVAKTATELLALIFAFIVGGPIGIGTVIVTFLIGPLIQWFYPIIEKRIHWQEVENQNEG